MTDFKKNIEFEVMRLKTALTQNRDAINSRKYRIFQKLEVIETETHEIGKLAASNDEYLQKLRALLSKYRDKRIHTNSLFYKIFTAWVEYCDFDPEEMQQKLKNKERMQFDEWYMLIGILRQNDLGPQFLGKKLNKAHTSIMATNDRHIKLYSVDRGYIKKYGQFKAFIEGVLDPDLEEVDLKSLEGQLENQRLFIKKKLKENVGKTITYDWVDDLMG